MMKLIFLSLFACFYCNALLGQSPQLRSEKELADSKWTDHTKCFAKLLEIQNIDSFLEFGVGEGTKFYLDHCKEVCSVEILGQAKMGNLPYYYDCCVLFNQYPNWSSILHFCGNALNNAVEIAEIYRVNPESLNNEYMQEIHQICDDLFKDKKYDAVFVDSAVIVRGSIVNALFNRTDIIMAHDYNALPHIYGWNWVKTPSSYEQIVLIS